MSAKDLTAEDWADIRERRESGERQVRLAEQYNIPESTISRRARAEGWNIDGNAWYGKACRQLKAVTVFNSDNAKLKRAAEILRRIAEGDSPQIACRAAGVPRSTYETWIRSQPQYSELVEQARGFVESDTLQKIRAAGDKDWKAYDRYLERLRPEEYGRNDASHAAPQVSITLKLSAPVQPQIRDITAESQEIPQSDD